MQTIQIFVRFTVNLVLKEKLSKFKARKNKNCPIFLADEIFYKQNGSF